MYIPESSLRSRMLIHSLLISRTQYEKPRRIHMERGPWLCSMVRREDDSFCLLSKAMKDA